MRKTYFWLSSGRFLLLQSGLVAGVADRPAPLLHFPIVALDALKADVACLSQLLQCGSYGAVAVGGLLDEVCATNLPVGRLGEKVAEYPLGLPRKAGVCKNLVGDASEGIFALAADVDVLFHGSV